MLYNLIFTCIRHYPRTALTGSHGSLQWQFVRGILVSAIYGGRVDNLYDERVLTSYLEQFFSDDALASGHLGPMKIPSTNSHAVSPPLREHINVSNFLSSLFFNRFAISNSFLNDNLHSIVRYSFTFNRRLRYWAQFVIYLNPLLTLDPVGRPSWTRWARFRRMTRRRTLAYPTTSTNRCRGCNRAIWLVDCVCSKEPISRRISLTGMPGAKSCRQSLISGANSIQFEILHNNFLEFVIININLGNLHSFVFKFLINTFYLQFTFKIFYFIHFLK